MNRETKGVNLTFLFLAAHVRIGRNSLVFFGAPDPLIQGLCRFRGVPESSDHSTLFNPKFCTAKRYALRKTTFLSDRGSQVIQERFKKSFENEYEAGECERVEEGWALDLILTL